MSRNHTGWNYRPSNVKFVGNWLQVPSAVQVVVVSEAGDGFPHEGVFGVAQWADEHGHKTPVMPIYLGRNEDEAAAWMAANENSARLARRYGNMAI